MSNRVYIFDTTLRDGEQSPGCSMTVPEKLRMARKLVELGVDILEAGFPIASDGDFEAVDAVSREYPWVQVAALARSCTLDVERAAAFAGKSLRFGGARDQIGGRPQQRAGLRTEVQVFVGEHHKHSARRGRHRDESEFPRVRHGTGPFMSHPRGKTLIRRGNR